MCHLRFSKQESGQCFYASLSSYTVLRITVGFYIYSKCSPLLKDPSLKMIVGNQLYTNEWKTREYKCFHSIFTLTRLSPFISNGFGLCRPEVNQ